MSVRLAFDTATPEGSVALELPGGAVVERAIGSSVRHAESLLPAIADLLSQADFRPGDLDEVVVGSGPGSFTGVRIAAATARGLVHALNVPLLAFGSLLAEAAAADERDRPVCALFDARRNEVYAACYRFAGDGWATLLDPAAIAVEDLVLRTNGLEPLWTGDGARMHAAALGAIHRVSEPAMTRAGGLLRLAAQAPDEGRLEHPGDWEPEYLRPPGAERIRR